MTKNQLKDIKRPHINPCEILSMIVNNCYIYLSKNALIMSSTLCSKLEFKYSVQSMPFDIFLKNNYEKNYYESSVTQIMLALD